MRLPTAPNGRSGLARLPILSSRLFRLGVHCGQWQPHLETGVAGLRLHLEIPVMLVHDDPPRDVEAQAGALTDRLGGEERLEDPAGDVGWHARSGVTELDQHLIAVERGPHGERAGPVHRRHGVVDQIRPDLVEFRWVGGDRGQGPVVVFDHRDAAADLAAKHEQGAVQQVMHINDLEWCPFELRVLLRCPHQSGDPGGRVLDLVHQKFGLKRVVQPVHRTVQGGIVNHSRDLVEPACAKARSCSLIRVSRVARWYGPAAMVPSLRRIPATRSRNAEVARTAAAAGLFSSWVRPADSEPSASSRSRWPITRCAFWAPKNSPSSRCMAIGNHSRISCANLAAPSTKKRDGSVARSEPVYSCGVRSSRYAWNAPAYTPRAAVRTTSTSSAPTRRDSTTAPS